MRENDIPVDAVTLHSLFALLDKFGDDTAVLQVNPPGRACFPGLLGIWLTNAGFSQCMAYTRAGFLYVG